MNGLFDTDRNLSFPLGIDYGTVIRGYFDYLALLVLDSVGCIIIGYCIGDTIQLIICDSFRKFVSEQQQNILPGHLQFEKFQGCNRLSQDVMVMCIALKMNNYYYLLLRSINLKESESILDLTESWQLTSFASLYSACLIL